MCLLFGATYPERTTAVIVIGGYARRMWAPDHPWATRPEEHDQFLEVVARDWGRPSGPRARPAGVEMRPSSGGGRRCYG
jgi:hypothetical protein